jgi:hypothetical protein
MNTTFREFVAWAEGPRRAAELLGCSEALVYHILNGRRNVSKKLANKAYEVSGGQFSRAALLFGDTAAA